MKHFYFLFGFEFVLLNLFLLFSIFRFSLLLDALYDLIILPRHFLYLLTFANLGLDQGLSALIDGFILFEFVIV